MVDRYGYRVKNAIVGLLARVPLSFALLALLFIFNYVAFQTRSGVIHPTLSVEDGAFVGGSFLGVLLFWFIVGTLFSWGPRSYVTLFGIYSSLYHLFATYHFRAKIPFDIALFLDNADETFNEEALLVILDSISIHVLLIGFSVIVVSLAVPFLRRRIAAERGRGKVRIIAAAAAVPIYSLLLLSPYTVHDDLGMLVRSLYDYFRRDSLYHLSSDVDPDSYPFIVADNSLFPSRPPTRLPSIFILEIESFSQKVVEKKAPNGEPLTPFFNEKIKEGLYVERFYGNSIQSSKGQFATLFSLIPSFKQKVFTSYTGTHFQSLAQVLRNHGYVTLFFKAYKNINFDNTGNFVKKNGFDDAFSIVPFLSEEEKRSIWGWGVEDQVFYRRFFEYLDTREEIASGTKPVFVILHTVMNHMRFDKVPPEKRKIYPNPRSLPEHYANSIRLTDDQLPVFFEELAKRPQFKDAIVIVTGDHSYPLNEHGYQHNESAWYEEFFRTPFLLIAPGRFKPGRITDRAYSQMDIAPTLLDLVGIRPKRHHFRGVSMFSGKPQHPIFLIQPYNGTYLGVIEGGRWKYVYHLRSNREYLYDLRDDPDERNNLAEKADPAFKERLKGLLQVVYLNQKLIETDRIWKPE